MDPRDLADLMGARSYRETTLWARNRGSPVDWGSKRLPGAGAAGTDERGTGLWWICPGRGVSAGTVGLGGLSWGSGDDPLLSGDSGVRLRPVGGEEDQGMRKENPGRDPHPTRVGREKWGRKSRVELGSPWTPTDLNFSSSVLGDFR